MRFTIACRNLDTDANYLLEVIGDVVEIEGMPEGSCAVHALPMNFDAEGPLYAVSHMESGKRIVGADSIDFAIKLARDLVANTDPEKRDGVIQAAIQFKRELEHASQGC